MDLFYGIVVTSWKFKVDENYVLGFGIKLGSVRGSTNHTEVAHSSK